MSPMSLQQEQKQPMLKPFKLSQCNPTKASQNSPATAAPKLLAARAAVGLRSSKGSDALLLSCGDRVSQGGGVRIWRGLHGSWQDTKETSVFQGRRGSLART